MKNKGAIWFNQKQSERAYRKHFEWAKSQSRAGIKIDDQHFSEILLRDPATKSKASPIPDKPTYDITSITCKGGHLRTK